MCICTYDYMCIYIYTYVGAADTHTHKHTHTCTESNHRRHLALRLLVGLILSTVNIPLMLVGLDPHRSSLDIFQTFWQICPLLFGLLVRISMFCWLIFRCFFKFNSPLLDLLLFHLSSESFTGKNISPEKVGSRKLRPKNMPLGIPVLITYLLVGYSVGAEPSVVSSPNQWAVGTSMLMDWKTPKKNTVG